jgi:hypothetical protein
MSLSHVAAALMLFVAPSAAFAQQVASEPAPGAATTAIANQQSNVPAQVRQVEDDIERAARRFGLGVQAGVGIDPELIMFGAHGTFGPIFRRGIDFRPGIEFGLGEVTTMFAINLDVLYTLPGSVAGERWAPYVGVGPNFALSHVGFDSADEDDDGEDRNRFDFGDTDFEGGFNFVAGARNRNGMFLEMKATAYGVTNVRLLVGYTF